MLNEFGEITGLPSALAALWSYLVAGGLPMMLPLALAAALLWYAIGVRWVTLARGSGRNVRVLIRRFEKGEATPPNGIVDEAIELGVRLRDSRRAYLRRHLDEAFGELSTRAKTHATLITTLVAVAPLLGLLGTVVGMIETFESLGDMAMFTQGGGIAAGISTALFTTQMGLVVAAPGLIAKAVLDRRQHRIELDLMQIKDILVSAPRGSL
ncbi:MAG TPA: MotA/TolQ/ExbB proton channel family protein [Xanthomonadales bacterium]|nr:MotA/TolQ/ExbB proton channel family protein [Xanthomonadales bacterium]